jgi:hypothetical protein
MSRTDDLFFIQSLGGIFIPDPEKPTGVFYFGSDIGRIWPKGARPEAIAAGR